MEQPSTESLKFLPDLPSIISVNFAPIFARIGPYRLNEPSFTCTNNTAVLLYKSTQNAIIVTLLQIKWGISNSTSNVVFVNCVESQRIVFSNKV